MVFTVGEKKIEKGSSREIHQGGNLTDIARMSTFYPQPQQKGANVTFQTACQYITVVKIGRKD